MRNAVRLIVGIGVSAGCFYLATRGTDWSGVRAVLAGAHPFWAVVLIVASVFTVYVRARRWCILLRPAGQVSVYDAFASTAIGFGANTVLPFRLGEIVRPVLLGRKARIGMMAAFSSVVLERIFDMGLIIGCFLIVSLVYPDLPAGLRVSALGLAAGALLGLVVMFVVQRNRALVEHVLGVLPTGIERRLRPMVESFLNGLGAIDQPSSFLTVVAYSIYLWGAIVTTFLFGFLALDVPIPHLAGSLATMVIVAVFVALPQAPGFVGTWQAGCVLALGLFGVPQETAVGFSLFTWVVQMVVNLGTAGFFMAREDLSFAQVVRSATSEAPTVRAEG